LHKPIIVFIGSILILGSLGFSQVAFALTSDNGLGDAVVLIAGMQTNALSVLSAFVVIGAIAFGTLYIQLKENETSQNLL